MKRIIVKSITVRREFWKSFKNDFKDSQDLRKTQSFYDGYALGLFRAKRITEVDYNEMIKRINEQITWAETKKRYGIEEVNFNGKQERN